MRCSCSLAAEAQDTAAALAATKGSYCEIPRNCRSSVLTCACSCATCRTRNPFFPTGPLSTSATIPCFEENSHATLRARHSAAVAIHDHDLRRFRPTRASDSLTLVPKRVDAPHALRAATTTSCQPKGHGAT